MKGQIDSALSLSDNERGSSDITCNTLGVQVARSVAAKIRKRDTAFEEAMDESLASTLVVWMPESRAMAGRMLVSRNRYKAKGGEVNLVVVCVREPSRMRRRAGQWRMFDQFRP